MGNQSIRETIIQILSVNMGLKAGERVLFVTDIPRLEDWHGPYETLEEINKRAMLARQLFDLAKNEFKTCTFEFICFPTTGQHGTEPPNSIGEKMPGYDVILLLTTFSLTHTDARVQACTNGARVASMPGFEEAMLLPGGSVLTDNQYIFRETSFWAEKLTACNHVHILTSNGTDLSFSIVGRAGRMDHGLFHHRGDWGNLPSGEAYISPLEGTANGKIVVPPGWFAGLREEMILVFENGYVTSVFGGGQVGDQFRELFQFGSSEFQHRRNCAELGIGTNPNARNAENVLEAEKICNTIHIAVGDSAHMGGLTVSDVHEDFILPNPIVYFDDKIVMGS